MKISGRWIGLREANAALKNLPERVRPKIQQVIDVTAYQIARGAEGRVRRRTGLLARAITWQSRPRSLSAVVGISQAVVNDRGEWPFYYYFLEYGTVKMPPKPFLRPAAEAMQDDHAHRMEQALLMAKAEMEQEGSI